MRSGCEDQDDHILGWEGRQGEPEGHLVVGVDVLDSGGASSDCHVLRALLLQPLDHQLPRLFLCAQGRRVRQLPFCVCAGSSPPEVASQPGALETVQGIVPPQSCWIRAICVACLARSPHPSFFEASFLFFCSLFFFNLQLLSLCNRLCAHAQPLYTEVPKHTAVSARHVGTMHKWEAPSLPLLQDINNECTAFARA